MRQKIHAEQAPRALGPYSQAIKTGNTVYLAGQIGLDPRSGELVAQDITHEIAQVFANLQAVCQAAGGDLNHIVKLTVYLTNFNDYAALNQAMTTLFHEPYPARAVVQVVQLPKNAHIEIDAIMVV